jgi:flavin reductase
MSWIDQHPDMAGAFEAVADAKSVDPQSFRESMSRLGAAVHIITTDGPSGRTGFTATAVCSVSDAPPTLLVCLNRSATSMPILRGNGVFCVNTLRAGDELIADTFAGRTKVAREARFDTGEWGTLSTVGRWRRGGGRSTAAVTKSKRWPRMTYISAVEA